MSNNRNMEYHYIGDGVTDRKTDCKTKCLIINNFLYYFSSFLIVSIHLTLSVLDPI